MKKSGECMYSETAFRSIESNAKRFRFVVAACLFALSLISLLVALGSYAHAAYASAADAAGAASALSPHVLAGFPALVVGVAAVFCAFKLTSDASAGRPLFSVAQSRRMRAIGVLFVTCAVVHGALLAGAVCPGMGDWVPLAASIDTIYNEILLIVAAIGSFYLSYIFKCGSFLQYMFEETV